MQDEITREHRMATDVWTYRWRSLGETGKLVRHRIVLGSVQQFPTADLVRQTFAGIIRGINSGDIRMQASSMQMSELVDHYKRYELACRNPSICRDFVAAEDDKRFSTIEGYQGHLRSRILPRWGKFPLSDIKTVDIEGWLKTLTHLRNPERRLACGTRAKIRSVMKTLFNHAMRYELFDRNPVALCRQKGRRERSPEVLSIDDIRSLLAALDFREFVMVLLDVTTGLRLSELMGLQWQDIDFRNLQINVIRSIVKQRLGRCKTEQSLAAVPLHEQVAAVLRNWRDCAAYSRPSDWVFASCEVDGKMPYWGAPIMRKTIMPLARTLGITRLRGWHTFRHTYGSLLHEKEARLKVVQELMRHKTIRTTLDTYIQALTPSKRKAQKAVVKGLRLSESTNMKVM